MTSAFVTNELVTYDIAGQYWLDDLANGEDGESTENKGALGVGTYHEHARNRLRASVVATSLKGATKLGQNELKWGLTHQYEKIHDRVREWEMRDSAGYSLPHTGQSVEMIYNLFPDKIWRAIVCRPICKIPTDYVLCGGALSSLAD